jgi:hypothetical protein
MRFAIFDDRTEDRIENRIAKRFVPTSNVP